jgi:hypothetical protein
VILRELHYFLGIEVKKHQGGLLLTQERYANDILAWSRMEKCKLIGTPLSSLEKLSVVEGDPLGLEIPLSIGVLLAHYNIWRLLSLISALQLTKFVSSCMHQLRLIGVLSKGS